MISYIMSKIISALSRNTAKQILFFCSVNIIVRYNKLKYLSLAFTSIKSFSQIIFILPMEFYGISVSQTSLIKVTKSEKYI